MNNKLIATNLAKLSERELLNLISNAKPIVYEVSNNMTGVEADNKTKEGCLSNLKMLYDMMTSTDIRSVRVLTRASSVLNANYNVIVSRDLMTEADLVKYKNAVAKGLFKTGVVANIFSEQSETMHTGFRRDTLTYPEEGVTTFGVAWKRSYFSPKGKVRSREFRAIQQRYVAEYVPRLNKIFEVTGKVPFKNSFVEEYRFYKLPVGAGFGGVIYLGTLADLFGVAAFGVPLSVGLGFLSVFTPLAKYVGVAANLSISKGQAARSKKDLGDLSKGFHDSIGNLIRRRYDPHHSVIRDYIGDIKDLIRPDSLQKMQRFHTNRILREGVFAGNPEGIHDIIPQYKPWDKIKGSKAMKGGYSIVLPAGYPGANQTSDNSDKYVEAILSGSERDGVRIDTALWTNLKEKRLEWRQSLSATLRQQRPEGSKIKLTELGIDINELEEAIADILEENGQLDAAKRILTGATDEVEKEYLEILQGKLEFSNSISLVNNAPRAFLRLAFSNANQLALLRKSLPFFVAGSFLEAVTYVKDGNKIKVFLSKDVLAFGTDKDDPNIENGVNVDSVVYPGQAFISAGGSLNLSGMRSLQDLERHVLADEKLYQFTRPLMEGHGVNPTDNWNLWGDILGKYGEIAAVNGAIGASVETPVAPSWYNLIGKYKAKKAETDIAATTAVQDNTTAATTSPLIEKEAVPHFWQRSKRREYNANKKREEARAEALGLVEPGVIADSDLLSGEMIAAITDIDLFTVEIAEAKQAIATWDSQRLVSLSQLLLNEDYTGLVENDNDFIDVLLALEVGIDDINKAIKEETEAFSSLYSALKQVAFNKGKTEALGLVEPAAIADSDLLSEEMIAAIKAEEARGLVAPVAVRSQDVEQLVGALSPEEARALYEKLTGSTVEDTSGIYDELRTMGFNDSQINAELAENNSTVVDGLGLDFDEAAAADEVDRALGEAGIG